MDAKVVDYGLFTKRSRFLLCETEPPKKADNARKAAGKGSVFGDGVTLFLFACFVALIGAVIEIYNYVMFHVSAFFDMVLSYIPFL
jgi:hypothetical protein